MSYRPNPSAWDCAGLGAASGPLVPFRTRR